MLAPAAQVSGLAGLALEVTAAAGFEEGFGGAVAVVGGEGAGAGIEDADRAGAVDFGGQAFGPGALQKLHGHFCVLVRVACAEVRAMAREVIGERRGIAPSLSGVRRAGPGRGSRRPFSTPAEVLLEVDDNAEHDEREEEFEQAAHGTGGIGVRLRLTTSLSL